LIQQLEKAFEAHPDIDTAMLVVGYLHSAGLFDIALEKAAYIRSRAPHNPVARYEWDKRLDEVEPALKLLVEQAKKAAENNPPKH
jgi:hypothetical protein